MVSKGVLLFAIFLMVATISADLIAPPDIAKPFPNPGNGATTSNAYYQVVFDERGQALSLAKFEISNFEKSNLNEIAMEIPGNTINLRYVLIGSPSCSRQCAEYEQVCSNLKKVCNNWDSATSTCKSWGDECIGGYTSQCARYDQTCPYGNYFYDDYSTSYTIADFEKISANTYKVKFQTPIQSGGRAVVLVAYRAFGYAKMGMTTDFDFETIKLPIDIDYTRVAIDVDKGLELKGSPTHTDYVQSYNIMESSLASAPKASQVSGATLDYARGIRNAQGLVKEKNGLLANEAFHVSGSYADSGWKLHIFEWAFWLILAIATIAAIVKFAVPFIAGMFSKFLPQNKDKKKPEEFNHSRSLMAGLMATACYAITTGAFSIIYMLYLKMTNSYSSSGELIFLGILLLGLVIMACLFAYMLTQFSLGDAVVSSLIFFMFSIIIVPATFFIVFLVSTMFLTRSYY